MLAQQIAKMVPGAESADLAPVIRNLAETYANLAVEPPRTRAG